MNVHGRYEKRNREFLPTDGNTGSLESQEMWATESEYKNYIVFLYVPKNIH